MVPARQLLLQIQPMTFAAALSPASLDSRRPGRALVRACAAAVRAKASGTGVDPERVARAMFGDDPVSIAVLRAAVAPATTATPGWAAEIAGSAVADFLANLGTASAAS